MGPWDFPLSPWCSLSGNRSGGSEGGGRPHWRALVLSLRPHAPSCCGFYQASQPCPDLYWARPSPPALPNQVWSCLHLPSESRLLSLPLKTFRDQPASIPVLPSACSQVWACRQTLTGPEVPSHTCPGPCAWCPPTSTYLPLCWDPAQVSAHMENQIPQTQTSIFPSCSPGLTVSLPASHTLQAHGLSHSIHSSL